MSFFTHARRLIAAVIAFVLLLPLLVVGPANAIEPAGDATTSAASGSFSDVPSTNQFYKEISWLATEKISTGYSDGTFRPLQPVNRDAMAAFMYRLAGSPAYTPPATSPFKDVTTRTQFYKEISWLASKKISTGYSDKTYRPLEPVNRDAMAAFMYRLASSPSYVAPATPRFTDVGTSVQFYKEISWLASKKISEGWPDKTYRPLLPVNRDAMAAFMYRYAGSPVVALDPLSPVTGLSISSSTPSSVTLKWVNPTTSGYSGVLIRRAAGSVAPTSTGAGDAVTDVASPKTSVTNPGLKPKTTYSYALFAHDARGNFAKAANITVTTPLDPAAGPTLSEQRAALRDRVYAAKVFYVDSRPFISLLARADGLIVKDAIAKGTVSLDQANALVTNAATQSAMTAAERAVNAEYLRADTVKTTATQMKTLRDLRAVQQKVANTALTDLKAGRISAPSYQAAKARGEAFTTLLASDRRAQREVIGTVAGSSNIQAPAWRDELEGRTGTIPSSSGWVGFLGGCALPLAEARFTPKLPATGPGIATNSALVAAANARGASDPSLTGIHAQMLRSASTQAAEVLTMDQLRAGYSARVARLGYGWLQNGNIQARDALLSDTRKILESGPESMNTLTSSHLLLAASTAGDWASLAGMEETVLVRWLGPQTCLHADRENFVDAPNNIAAIHNSATFAAAAVFLEKSPTQAAALAKESLVSIQPALKMIITDGGTQEGPGYWTYQSRALAALYSTLPNVYSADPMPMPSLLKTVNYALNSTPSDGLPTPFADAEPDALSPLMPAWAAFVSKDPGAAAWVGRELKAKPDAYLMWWWVKPGTLPEKRSSVYPQTGLAALHLPAGVLQGTATVKGGDNSANHAHLDLGTLSFYRKSVQWAIDPGSMLNSPSGYYSASTRWNFWKTTTAAHSTLSVAGANQPVMAKAATSMQSSTSASVDLTQALAGSTSAKRSIEHTQTAMTVRDTVTSASGLPLTWQWVTDAAVTVDPTRNIAILTKSGQQVTIQLGGVPGGSKLSVVQAPETSNTGATLRIIRLVTPKVTSLNLTATVK